MDNSFIKPLKALKIENSVRIGIKACVSWPQSEPSPEPAVLARHVILKALIDLALLTKYTILGERELRVRVSECPHSASQCWHVYCVIVHITTKVY